MPFRAEIQLAFVGFRGTFPIMTNVQTVVTVDDKKRIRLPDAKPGQRVAVRPNADGGWTLLPVKPAKYKPKFPPGSLLKYMTPERDKEETEAFKAFVQGPE